MVQNGSILTSAATGINNVTAGYGETNSNPYTEVTWTETTWVTKYENQTLNTTACPIYVQKLHILLNPWDDATWILTSAFVIFTMQSGFGLLESGTATAKNEVNIMVKNAVDVIFGGITYWMVGYSFSFGDSPLGNDFVGWGNFFLSIGMNTTTNDTLGWQYSNFIFQLAFATTATTIVSGAMVERTRLEAYIIFSFTNTFVYSFPTHWVWADKGFLKKLGVLDIAGAGPVHIAGGTTGFIATLVLRPRHRRYKTSTPPPMGSPTNALLGMFMLWWGWLGFNCGSTQGITKSKWAFAARSAVATICSSMAGGMVGIVLSYISKRRKFDIGYLINGVLGSLVSITALCTICPPKYSLLIGAIGGAIACGGTELLHVFHVDDPVGVIPVHFMCGIWSLLSAGLFATKEPEIEQLYDGLFMGGGFYLLGVQIASTLCIVAWCALLSLIVLHIIDCTIGLRFPFQEELLGADIVEHSIGLRKYDKIKKRLTDISRVRAYDMRRRKRYNASFREAEQYLTQVDASKVLEENGNENPATGKTLKRKGRFGRKSRSYGTSTRSDVYSISNGKNNGLVSRSRNHSIATSGNRGTSSPSLPSRGTSPQFKTRSTYRTSMTRVHGALRIRHNTKTTKWQQKLGVDNLAYLHHEKNESNGFVNGSGFLQNNDNVGGAERNNEKLIDKSSNNENIHIDDISIVIRRRSTVDSCTQTTECFAEENACCQTVSVDRSLVIKATSSDAEMSQKYAGAIELVHLGNQNGGESEIRKVTLTNNIKDISYEGTEYMV